jgi:hypothetical protein
MERPRPYEDVNKLFAVGVSWHGSAIIHLHQGRQVGLCGVEVVLADAESGRETNNCCRQDGDSGEEPDQKTLLGSGCSWCGRWSCTAGIAAVVLSMLLRCGVVGVVILLRILVTLGVDVPCGLLLRRLVVLQAVHCGAFAELYTGGINKREMQSTPGFCFHEVLNEQFLLYNGREKEKLQKQRRMDFLGADLRGGSRLFVLSLLLSLHPWWHHAFWRSLLFFDPDLGLRFAKAGRISQRSFRNNPITIAWPIASQVQQ